MKIAFRYDCGNIEEFLITACITNLTNYGSFSYVSQRRIEEVLDHHDFADLSN